ncbi:bestrophin family protein [Variovorax boronicumulans]|uniref:bestrophin family protein n=1 Tax=Variovorax boronicumulans TaxID=436515 RepID=UPI0012E63AE1|nr:bestrophin family ion channel [Variovorax boronicumulans]GER19672.1 bestrophin [Variovorax boronicumulans]
MIVRKRPSGLKLFLSWRGSVLPRIAAALTLNVIVAIVVTVLHGRFGSIKIPLGTVPFALLGLPLAIFLGFRNTAAYDRFWEARKLWGEVILRSRNLARQCQSLIDGDAPVNAGADTVRRLDDLRVRMTLRAAAFAHALRHQLRGTDAASDTQPFLREAEWQGLMQVANRPHALLMHMGADLREALRARRIDPALAAGVDGTLSALSAAAASCERILSTPIPFSYTLLLHRTAYLYCYLLPFGLVDSVGFMTPVVVLIVAYTFFGLDALGDEIEEPFGTESNDLPLEALCRTLEIDLCQSVGAPAPAPLVPVDYFLR